MALDAVTLGAAKKYTDKQIESVEVAGVGESTINQIKQNIKYRHSHSSALTGESNLEVLNALSVDDKDNLLFYNEKLVKEGSQYAKNIIFANKDPEFWESEDDINVQSAIDLLKFRQLYIINRAESIYYTPTDPELDIGGDVVSVQTAIDAIFGAIKEIALAEYISATDMPEIVKSVIDNLPKYNGEVAEV